MRRIPSILLVAALALGLTVVPAWAAVLLDVSGSGDADGRSWFVHPFEVTQAGPITVTLDWDDPAADVNVFLRAPGSNAAVAYDNGPDRPKVLVHDATTTGTWEVAVKVKQGATAYTVRVTDEQDAPPTPSATPGDWWQADGRVRDVLRVGDQIWLTGHFDAIRPPGTAKGDPASLARGGLAVLDRTTGAPLPFDTPDLQGNGWALAVSPDASTVYVGGTFRNVDGITRKRIAAVDTATGALTDWDPRANSLVRAIAVTDDGTVIVGGQFTWIAGTSHDYIAALDPVSADADPAWLPVLGQQSTDPCPPRCEPFVDALTLGRDGELYIGGHFGTVNGLDRTNGAAIALADPGTTLPWDPNAFTPSTQATQLSVITQIALPPPGSTWDDRVLLCGDFKRVNGQLSTNIGIVDAATGVTVPGTDVQSNGGTPSCQFDGETMYVGGHFTRVGPGQEGVDGLDRAHIAALDPQDGSVLPWDPSTNSKLGVHGMLLTDEAVYLAGDFTRTGGAAQQGIARYELIQP